MSSAASRQIGTGGGFARPPANALWSRITASAWTYRLIVLVIFGGLWELYGATTDQQLTIPSFSETIVGVIELVQQPEVYQAFVLSNNALVFGFAVSLLLGISLGLAAARFTTVEGFVDPYLAVLLVTPMAALIPLLIMAFGVIDDAIRARVFLIVVFALPVIIVNSRAGVRQVDGRLIEMATSFGASERQIWRRVLLPGALPAIMTGVRLGLGRAVTGMVVIELLMVSVGIGKLISAYKAQFEPGLVFGVVVLAVAEALILISIVRWIERRIAPWSRETVLRE